MPELPNAQYERYAQEIVRGMSQADAYRAAKPSACRWTEKTVYSRASEMRRIPEVDERIKELQAEAAAAAVMDYHCPRRAYAPQAAHAGDRHPQQDGRRIPAACRS